jgi:hypothetical protein
MGSQICHSWEHTFNCDNDQCDNEIEIKYEVWEYPPSSFETDDVKISGGEEESRFNYDFHGEEELD